MEGRVHWNYRCPICGRIYPYGMFAGIPVRICKECKEIKHRASKLFTNPGDALIAFRELKKEEVKSK